MKINKIILIICVLGLLLVSCLYPRKHKEDSNPKKEMLIYPEQKEKDEPNPVEIEKKAYKSIDHLRKNIVIFNDSLLDERVIKEITSYYKKEYEKQWDILLKKYNHLEQMPSIESKTDSIVYLEFDYSEGQNENPIIVGMINCLIPTKQGINLYMSSPILYTDLNSDESNDLIVVVHTEGGWRGGNTYNQDIFVFLNENNTFKLTSVTTDREMVNPDTYGYIRVKNAKNGILMAEASFYTERDARCCPSDHYFMKYKYEDNKFVITSSEFIGSDF